MEGQPIPITNGFTLPSSSSDGETEIPSFSPSSFGSLTPISPPSAFHPRKKYIIGVCAMDDKARSKPMRNILDRLLNSGPFEAIIFGDKCILDEDVKAWPACDFFISFFSKGFPLRKSIEYVKLRTPFCVNEVDMQTVLWDRRLVLEIMDQIGVQTPKRLTMDRDGGPGWMREGVSVPSTRSKPEFKIIDQDTIQIGDQIMTKPFVEKPVSGEDHNIHVYYHSSAGGGGRRLFRKVANKSSEFDPDLNTPRIDGSYIYEEFLDVDNAEDIKVYTIGDQFVYAETRKSPVVDGHVRRNTDGREIRYVAQLTPEEKSMAASICKVFGQRVCGFDLLRVSGKSYVIDVNGWSFVKGNNYYYNNCARILQDVFLRNARQRKLSEVVFPRELSAENSWRLKAFVSVFRHADRTPKQKMKFTFSSAPFRELLNGGGEEVIIRNAKDLKLVCAAAEQAMEEGLEDSSRLMLLKISLTRSQIYQAPKFKSSPLLPKMKKATPSQSSYRLLSNGEGRWFTHAAKYQSRDLGDNLRKDLQIMNKQVLDDVKIFTSSERRVRATAELFTQRFLDIREVPKDMLLIRKEMLDDSNAAKEKTDIVKKELHDLLQPDNADKIAKIWPKGATDPGEIVQDIIVTMRKLREIMRRNFKILDIDSIQRSWCCYEDPSLFYERWEKIFGEFADGDRDDFDPSKVSDLYDSLKYDALHNRTFLEKIFIDSESDSGMGPLKDLYSKAKILFDFVAPLEYGISEEDRLEIGLLTSMPLIKQIVEDLESCKRPDAAPCTRLYFTKESHVHTLLNIVYLSGIPTRLSKSKIPELDYLTQITFELYERSSPVMPGNGSRLMTGSSLHDENQHFPSSSPEYSLRIGFSPGAGNPNILDLHMDSKHCLSVMQRRNLTDHSLLTTHCGSPPVERPGFVERFFEP
ncbi:histidine phosphatase superfamily-domain-containing protein [Lobosporangium transversale]|uniref:Inositol hexakisphosphate and diphosphoinositol-pentakisphosphate kinase n=1 Tax=Lobosporangium transversale TaxID=64571 RepID=A0A1Y2FYP5_9FUNG|nr:histidine phosphatase superfamily-domain-containing protein [Lobosporangium transversale]ORY89201.1 histidine phosphatase superfamily-domain-containing protein [Lobosporangium transversale]|eukprot:XP_021875047.1 histidine phosphatase superfamily-domain-containing protein [Lobosporangium transversale]